MEQAAQQEGRSEEERRINVASTPSASNSATWVPSRSGQRLSLWPIQASSSSSSSDNFAVIKNAMQVADPISALVNGMNDMHILYLDAINPNKIVGTQDCSVAPKVQSSLGWNAPPCDGEVQNGHILRQFDDQTATEDNIRDLCDRWSPTKTPVAFCDWISIDRGTVHRTHQFQIENMQAAFRTLSEISVDALDQLACQHEVISGKWLLFVKASVVDSLWRDVVRLVCLYRKTGCAKVTPNKGTDFYLICVYVEDYTTEELHLVRDGLRNIGVTWPIGFKMDAYTHLGIYAKNPWSIRPNRFWL